MDGLVAFGKGPRVAGGAAADDDDGDDGDGGGGAAVGAADGAMVTAEDAAGGDAEADAPQCAQYKHKHRNVRRNWALPSGFPSRAVTDAYLRPSVDASEAPCDWSRPDLDALRRFCEDKFGWTAERADQDLLPMMAEYEKSSAQSRIDAHFTERRFAKVGSSRLASAIKQHNRHDAAGPPTTVAAAAAAAVATGGAKVARWSRWRPPHPRRHRLPKARRAVRVARRRPEEGEPRAGRGGAVRPAGRHARPRRPSATPDDGGDQRRRPDDDFEINPVTVSTGHSSKVCVLRREETTEPACVCVLACDDDATHTRRRTRHIQR